MRYEKGEKEREKREEKAAKRLEFEPKVRICSVDADTGEGWIHIHPVELNGKGIFLGRESGGGSALLAGWPSLIRSCVAAALDRDESTRELRLIRGSALRRSDSLASLNYGNLVPVEGRRRDRGRNGVFVRVTISSVGKRSVRRPNQSSTRWGTMGGEKGMPVQGRTNEHTIPCLVR